MFWRNKVTGALLAVGAAGAMTLGLAGPAAAEPAAPAGWPPSCLGSVCFWSENGFTGQTWTWNTGNGYADLPAFLHDHVGSFVATREACFINWSPVEKHTALAGDWRSSYLADFGARMDGVAPGRC